MNDTQSSVAKMQVGAKSDVNFLDLLIILAKNKRFIVSTSLGFAVLAAAASFFLPSVFLASTIILPPQQSQSVAAAILSQLGGVASAVSGGAGVKNPSDVYIAMLKSRTVADKLIAKFQLDKIYGTDSPEKTRKALMANTTITLGKDGLITVDVEGESKKEVAPIANSYVDELLNLTRVMALTEASQRRKFFEYQLEKSKNNLASAEMALKLALDTRGVISVDSESRVLMETVGRLRAQMTAKEIQLSAMSSFVTANNQEYKRAQEELNSLRIEISRLENGRHEPSGTATQKIENRAGLENIKILREVKYHQMLYELLTKQYEVARLDEARESIVIQVLDSAIEPERKLKPRRVLLVLSAGLVGLFLATLWACIADLMKSALLVPARAAQFAKLASHINLKK